MEDDDDDADCVRRWSFAESNGTRSVGVGGVGALSRESMMLRLRNGEERIV